MPKQTQQISHPPGSCSRVKVHRLSATAKTYVADFVPCCLSALKLICNLYPIFFCLNMSIMRHYPVCFGVRAQFRLLSARHSCFHLPSRSTDLFQHYWMHDKYHPTVAFMFHRHRRLGRLWYILSVPGYLGALRFITENSETLQELKIDSSNIDKKSVTWLYNVLVPYFSSCKYGHKWTVGRSAVDVPTLNNSLFQLNTVSQAMASSLWSVLYLLLYLLHPFSLLYTHNLHTHKCCQM